MDVPRGGSRRAGDLPQVARPFSHSTPSNPLAALTASMASSA